MPEIYVTIEATEPMELMRNECTWEVWFKNLGYVNNSYWEVIEIRGEPREIHGFISEHWSEAEADYYVYRTGALTRE